MQGRQEQQHRGGGVAIILPDLAGFSGRKSVMARVSTAAMAAIILVLFTGCAGEPAIEPEPRVVRVEVPVPVPCRVTIPMAPAWASAGLRKGDDLETKVRALVAEREQRMGYEALLLAAARSCQ